MSSVAPAPPSEWTSAGEWGQCDGSTVMPRLFTAADIAVFPVDLPSGPIDFELDNGRIVSMSPPGRRHGSLQARLVAALVAQGEDRGYGEAFSEVGVVLGRNPDCVYGPDAAFVVASRLPVRESPEGYLETIPDLVAEVRSKNDSAAYLQHKVERYLDAGVQVVWLIDGESRTVVVSRCAEPPQTVTDVDTLQCEPLIPGFELRLPTLFGRKS